MHNAVRLIILQNTLPTTLANRDVIARTNNAYDLTSVVKILLVHLKVTRHKKWETCEGKVGGQGKRIPSAQCDISTRE
jgi:hypothetical protein